MESRGRGRARGTPRPTQPDQASRPGPSQGQGRPRPQTQQPGQQAWARPQQAPRQAPPAQMGAWVRPLAPSTDLPSAGRGSRQTQASGGGGDEGSSRSESRTVITGGGGGEGNQSRGGNGGVRGRSNRTEILTTKPKEITTKKGTSGKPIRLTANFFELLQAGKWGLNQYRVDFEPAVDETGPRRGMLRDGMKDIIKSGYLFDGTVLYTTQRLHQDPLEVFVKDKNDQVIRITIRLVGDVAWGDYHYIQLFNIIIRKCLAYMQLQLVGRNFFDPHHRISIPQFNLELWPGYYTSMRQHENSILMNCDVAFKVMRTDNVYDMLLEARGLQTRGRLTDDIIGSVVLTYYNNKTYKVDDIDYNVTPRSTFKLKDGSSMSYMDYVKQKYNIASINEQQPMLVSVSKPREIRSGMADIVYLIPQLCQLTGLTDMQRTNVQLMRSLADHTRIAPRGRVEKLMEFSRKMTSNPEIIQEIRRWDLNLARSIVEVQGRVMPEEKIVFGNNEQVPAGENADWQSVFRSKAMFVNEAMQNRLVVICPKRNRRETEGFIQCLQRVARGMRWDIGNPRIIDIAQDSTKFYADAITHVIPQDPRMILTVVTTPNAERYGAIKRMCYCDAGIPNQVITLRKVSDPKGQMSIATKVAIQMNCKIGGAPWTVIMPLNNVMIVGYDVCRDTVNKSKSFAGVVASLNKQITRYFSIATEHKFGEELSTNIASIMVTCCIKYKKVNGCFPDKIMFYRDGVGEGQLAYVYEHEVQAIKQALKREVYGGQDPRFAFVVVSKRINTRIFNGGFNPPPGTVVDDVITQPERYDFFIVAQCVRQGTVTPTSYNVIEDTFGLPPDRMQMLTYKLCHMYYNWSGTVRVPAPCQYAHKLAFLVSQSLHKAANPVLETLLYYL